MISRDQGRLSRSVTQTGDRIRELTLFSSYKMPAPRGEDRGASTEAGRVGAAEESGSVHAPTTL